MWLVVERKPRRQMSQKQRKNCSNKVLSRPLNGAKKLKHLDFLKKVIYDLGKRI